MNEVACRRGSCWATHLPSFFLLSWDDARTTFRCRSCFCASWQPHVIGPFLSTQHGECPAHAKGTVASARYGDSHGISTHAVQKTPSHPALASGGPRTARHTHFRLRDEPCREWKSPRPSRTRPPRSRAPSARSPFLPEQWGGWKAVPCRRRKWNWRRHHRQQRQRHRVSLLLRFRVPPKATAAIASSSSGCPLPPSGAGTWTRPSSPCRRCSRRTLPSLATAITTTTTATRRRQLPPHHVSSCCQFRRWYFMCDCEVSGIRILFFRGHSVFEVAGCGRLVLLWQRQNERRRRTEGESQPSRGWWRR
jgi:hypothetical protein